MQASSIAESFLPSAPPLPPMITNGAVKRALQSQQPMHKMIQGSSPVFIPAARPIKWSQQFWSDSATLPTTNDDKSIYEAPAGPFAKRPWLTDSMNSRFFDKSAMGKAWEAQKHQDFSKDNLDQSYTVTASFFHVILPVLKRRYLAPMDIGKLCASSSPIAKLWSEYQRVCNLNWRPLCAPNPLWQEQLCIDDERVNLRTAMLFHYDMDLATVHHQIGGNHISAHHNSAKILARLQHLLEPKLIEELRRILVNGCPAQLNVEGTSQEFTEMFAYGNHPSLTKNLDKVMVMMNKEDKKDHVLMFPS
jgi:hypothetical protein